MKITKQRLKEIIREELGSVEEGVFTSRLRQKTAQTNLASVQKAEKLVKQLVDEFNNAGSNEEKKEIQGRIQGLLKAVSRIQEGESDWYDDENETRADRKYADSQAGLGDIQSTDRLTGGSPEERLITLIKARELLAAMSEEELEELSLSLDAETVAALRHLLANPMYKPGLEEYRSTGTGDQKKPAPRPSSDTRPSNTGYRSGATGKRNQGRGGY